MNLFNWFKDLFWKTVIHEFENGHHRLIYKNGKQGEWAEYEKIARLDNYAAVTNHYSDSSLPPVFIIKEVKNAKNYFLDLNSENYWD